MAETTLPQSAFTGPLETNIVHLIFDRLETWKNTLSLLIDYFSQLEELEKHERIGYAKAAAVLEGAVKINNGGTSGRALAGETRRVKSGSSSGSASASPQQEPTETSINSWLLTLRGFAQGASENGHSLAVFIANDTLPALAALREELRRNARSFGGRISTLNVALAKEHDALLTTMDEHQKIWLLIVNGATPGSGSNGSVDLPKDPWLSELELRNRIAAYLEEKRRYFDSVAEVFQEWRAVDLANWDGIKLIVCQFFSQGAKHSHYLTEQLENVSLAMGRLDPEHEWKLGLRKNRLDHDWRLEVPPLDGFTQSVLGQIGSTLASLAPMPASLPHPLVHAFRIIKAGYLLRPGGSFRRAAWETVFVVLTDSRYLHGYSLSPRRKSSSSEDAAKNEQSYRIPKYGQRILPKALAEMNAEIANVWLRPGTGATPEPPHSDLLKPEFSIRLPAGTTVSVALAEEWIWEVKTPAGTGFFARGEKRYSLRSLVEEDMVDWCIAVKAIIDDGQNVRGQPAVTTKQGASPENSSEWDENVQDEQPPVVPPVYRSPFGVDSNSELNDGSEPALQEAENDGESRIKSDTPAEEPKPPRSDTASAHPIELDNPWDN